MGFGWLLWSCSLEGRLGARARSLGNLEHLSFREDSEICPSAPQVLASLMTSQGLMKPVSQKDPTPRLLSLEVPDTWCPQVIDQGTLL